MRELVGLEQFAAVDMLSPDLEASGVRLVSLPISFDGKRPHPRTLAPLDTETILTSVAKTGRLIIVHEAARNLGLGAEIAALVAER